MSADTSEANVKKLAGLIKGIKVAMLTTQCDDGTLRSRPMVTQEADFDGTLWFFTRADTPKCDEVGHHQQVNVSYASPDDQRYVSVSGKGQLVRDRAKIKELWNPVLKAWFPQGLDDPQLALIRVDAEKAEYWDSASSTLVHLVGFVKAVATGTPYRPGDNAKVDLHAQKT